MSLSAPGEPTDPADEDLMASCRAGDTQAFSELYSRYRQPISRYVRRIVGDAEAADDITQETFCRAFSSRDRFRPEGCFSAWLYAIAHNLCANELRRRASQATLSLHAAVQMSPDEDGSEEVELHETLADPAETVEARLERRELAELVEEATERLSGPQKDVLKLRFGEGMQYGDIGAVLGCSLGTVKSRLHHAIKRIRRIIGAAP